MKRNQFQTKKYPLINKKKEESESGINLSKKNTSTRENNSTLLKFFKVSSVHKSTSTPVPEKRQTTINLNNQPLFLRSAKPQSISIRKKLNLIKTIVYQDINFINQKRRKIYY